jgi:AraC-like DNA-binding protein
MHRVLPDNCVDILWQDSGSSAFAVGMMSSAIFVASSGPVQTVAVRFLPGAARSFFGVPLGALTDGRADLDELWGRSCADRLQDGLWTRALSDRERLDLIEQALVERLVAHGAQPVRGGRAVMAVSPLARIAVARIEACGGALRVESLADDLRVSRQHLAAQFREQVGLSPKLFARITRFRRATEKARGQQAVDWAALALDCGYFDQSHLIRDFHDFATTTPEQFLDPAAY